MILVNATLMSLNSLEMPLTGAFLIEFFVFYSPACEPLDLVPMKHKSRYHEPVCTWWCGLWFPLDSLTDYERSVDFLSVPDSADQGSIPSRSSHAANVHALQKVPTVLLQSLQLGYTCQCSEMAVHRKKGGKRQSPAPTYCILFFIFF